MGYFVDSYERNKKYLVAFAVLAFCIAVIYTKRLVDFPKIGVALFVVLAFFFSFTEEECWDLPCDAHWWSVPLLLLHPF